MVMLCQSQLKIVMLCQVTARSGNAVSVTAKNGNAASATAGNGNAGSVMAMAGNCYAGGKYCMVMVELLFKKLCCGHGIHRHPVGPGCRKQVTR